MQKQKTQGRGFLSAAFEVDKHEGRIINLPSGGKAVFEKSLPVFDVLSLFQQLSGIRAGAGKKAFWEDVTMAWPEENGRETEFIGIRDLPKRIEELRRANDPLIEDYKKVLKTFTDLNRKDRPLRQQKHKQPLN